MSLIRPHGVPLEHTGPGWPRRGVGVRVIGARVTVYLALERRAGQPLVAELSADGSGRDAFAVGETVRTGVLRLDRHADTHGGTDRSRLDGIDIDWESGPGRR